MVGAFAHRKAFSKAWGQAREVQIITQPCGATASPPLLCPEKPHVIPATYPQMYFFSWQVLSGLSHLYIIRRCIPQAGSQNKAEYTLIKGNIHLMQKVNQGDKFKSFLCHCYRKGPQSLIGSIENLKRYRNYCKIDCLL